MYHTPGLSLQRYRGDPGLPMILGAVAGGLIRTAGKGVAKLAGKMIARRGTVAVAAVSAVAGAVRGRGSSTPPITAFGGPSPGVGGIGLPGKKVFIPRYGLPGGHSPFQLESPPAPGYHMNKAYKRWRVAVANGRNVKEPHWVNMWVRARRMNVANGRALTRAATRGKKFVKIYRRFASMFGARRGRAAAKGRRR